MESSPIQSEGNTIQPTQISLKSSLGHPKKKRKKHVLDQTKLCGSNKLLLHPFHKELINFYQHLPGDGYAKQALILEKYHHYGNIHIEELCQSVERWYATSKYLKQEMNLNLRMTDPFIPDHTASYSRAHVKELC